MNSLQQGNRVKWFREPEATAPYRSIGRLRLALLVALMVSGLTAGLALSTWTFRQTNDYLMTVFEEPGSSTTGAAISQ